MQLKSNIENTGWNVAVTCELKLDLKRLLPNSSRVHANILLTLYVFVLSHNVNGCVWTSNDTQSSPSR